VCVLLGFKLARDTPAVQPRYGLGLNTGGLPLRRSLIASSRVGYPGQPRLTVSVSLSLARLSHHPPAAARDLPASTALRSGRVLNVVSATPPRPTRRAPCRHGHLPRLATACGEKCGLERDDVADLDSKNEPSASEGQDDSQFGRPVLVQGPEALFKVEFRITRTAWLQAVPYRSLAASSVAR